MTNIFYGKSKDMAFVPDNKKSWLEYLIANEGKSLIVEINKEKGVRTSPQNNALHLWCEQVAKELNEKGLSVQEILKKTIEIDWNGMRVKEIIWRSVQEAITGKKSTKELNNTDEINTIYEHLNRFLAEKCDGIHVPFPDKSLLTQKSMPVYPLSDKNITAF